MEYNKQNKYNAYKRIAKYGYLICHCQQQTRYNKADRNAKQDLCVVNPCAVKVLAPMMTINNVNSAFFLIVCISFFDSVFFCWQR